MVRRFTASMASRGVTRALAMVGSLAALVIGGALGLVFAAGLAVLALVASLLLAFTAIAVNARRTASATARDPSVIEAHRIGGHSWVAYGWQERR
jgi:uncharacterized protein (DUF58 family)